MILIYRLLSCSLLPCQSSFIANERELNNLQYHQTKKLSSNVTAMIADIVVYRGPITLIEHLFFYYEHLKDARSTYSQLCHESEDKYVLLLHLTGGIFCFAKRLHANREGFC